jgi:cold-inducible RNA-binding protein
VKNIFVGNLSFQATEDGLRSTFAPFGEVLNVKMITDRDTGRARGFAFVEMANAEEADRAIADLSGKDLDGRSLTVNEAHPKGGDRSSTGRGDYRQTQRDVRW